MRAKYLGSVVLSLLLLSVVAAQDGGSHDALLVQVREASGRPVKYACVTVIPKEGEILFSKADGKGRVKFKGVIKGQYRVVVKADGYQAQKREVNVGGDAWTVDFSMQPRGDQ
jgi:uncharacterized membrane protein